MTMLFISMSIVCNASMRLYRALATLNIATCLILLVAMKRGLIWETSASYYILAIIALGGVIAAAGRTTIAPSTAPAQELTEMTEEAALRVPV
jgi:hypothetical protein